MCHFVVRQCTKLYRHSSVVFLAGRYLMSRLNNDGQTKQHLRPRAARHCRRSTVWCVQVLLTVPSGLMNQHHTNSYSKIRHKNAVWSRVFMHLGCYSLFVLVLSPVNWWMLVSVVSTRKSLQLYMPAESHHCSNIHLWPCFSIYPHSRNPKKATELIEEPRSVHNKSNTKLNTRICLPFTYITCKKING